MTVIFEAHDLNVLTMLHFLRLCAAMMILSEPNISTVNQTLMCTRKVLSENRQFHLRNEGNIQNKAESAYRPNTLWRIVFSVTEKNIIKIWIKVFLASYLVEK